ncbi:glycosyltransferase family 2 protein [Clostridium perfringens]|uniref:glycosyltransferase family 2 protein n=2 Tax=Clostridium perfringens TaxID=1502 RepID=UPI0010D6CE11|nr:glycosyltransferase family 2 protein [Clostridium perfringens]MDB2046936.1 glycosyltransferase family 2 protein [Clostridium perfringens]MDB2057983.1 glycosyltransferase family 2 protein [Clostridium perfringens]MDK0612326.1 glycosyltransferase family 2 protein [Clostridium perfringens]MDK0644887.1 glycosyltransferase family 2 protein [Clostridium perfringens]MDM0771745.1 glycosyltransferase family 2 protein [Clostridium perfringens]
MSKMFSIIVPAFNSENVIEKCLKSIAKQTYENFEVIIVNDGSTDNTEKICEKFCLSDNRFIIVNKVNEGVSKARNIGIKNASGKYIIFVDSDDTVCKTMCEEYIKILRLYNCDMIISNLKTHINNKIVNSQVNLEEKLYTKKEIGNEINEWYKKGLLNSPWSKCLKKSLICSYFDPDITIGEDLLFNLNYLNKCENIFFLNKSLYIYFVGNPKSLSTKYHENGFDNLNNVYNRTYDLFLVNFGESIDVTELDKKYVTDFSVMAERLFNQSFISQSIKYEILEEHRKRILKDIHITNINPDASLKFRIYWELIKKGRLNTFSILVKTISIIKKGVAYI